MADFALLIGVFIVVSLIFVLSVATLFIILMISAARNKKPVTARDAVAHSDQINKAKTRNTSRLIDTEGAGVRDLIAAGKVDEAVQLYAQFMGVDEYTARDSIEAMIAEEEEGQSRRAD